MSSTYVISEGSGFSAGSGNSQFAALKTSTVSAHEATNSLV